MGSLDHNVYALNASTGAFMWKHSTRNEVWSSPAVANGVLYVGSRDGGVYALSTSTGTLRWKFATGAE
jgi:eukaryotic-like serine/threonine-protein kinase